MAVERWVIPRLRRQICTRTHTQDYKYQQTKALFDAVTNRFPAVLRNTAAKHAGPGLRANVHHGSPVSAPRRETHMSNDIPKTDDRIDAIRKREWYRCQNCNRPESKVPRMEVHRIVPEVQGGTNRLTNFALLCGDCHDNAHPQPARAGD